MDEELGRRLDALERRLDQLETRVRTALPPPLVGWRDRQPLPMATAVAGPLVPAATTAPAIEPPLTDGDRYAANLRAAYDGGPPVVEAVPAMPLDSPVVVPSSIEVPAAPPPATERPANSWTPPSLPTTPRPLDLEHTVGLKWAGWVGAIVLVIGLVLGVKFAYDQGWLGGVPDAVRCALIAAAGFALIAGGEFVYRRVNTLAATGLYGAGVAVLYLAAYAGQAWYGLFAPPTAIVLMAGAALTGLLIAARADLVSIAALAVIGAAVCPFCFDSTPSPDGVRVYLLAVQALAVGLCAWRGERKWWTLRGLSLAGTSLGHLATLGPTSTGLDVLGIAIAGVSAALYQAELLWTTARRPADYVARRVPGLAFSLLVTATLTLEWLAYLDGRGRTQSGEAILILAAATFALRLVRFRPKLNALGRGFDVQTVLLLALAVPVLLDGPTRLFGWMALSAGLSLIGIGTRDRLAAVGAAALWGLAAIVTLVWADESARAATVWMTVGGDAVKVAVLVGLALVPIGHLAAFGLQRLGPNPDGGRAHLLLGHCVDLATAAAFALLLWNNAGPDLQTRAGIGYAVLLFAAAFLPGLPTLGHLATGALAVTTVKWAGSDVFARRLARDWHPIGRPFLNAQAATGGVLAGLFLLFGIVHRRQAKTVTSDIGETADRVWAVFLVVALLAVGFTATLEIDRAMAVGREIAAVRDATLEWTVTMLWSAVIAVGLVTLRWTIATDAVRRDARDCGHLVAYLLAAKFAVIDVLFLAGPVDVSTALVFNLRTVALAGVIAVLTLSHSPRRADDARPFFGLTVLALLLLTGSAEVNDYALTQTRGPVWIVRQVGWSIYWGALAVGALVTGFAVRRRPLRLAALGLLAVTLVKVTLIDLSGAGTGWRILSFLGLGGLLLATSVLYGRFERLTRQDAEPAAGAI